MNNIPDLRILFPTSFSEGCFRTTRALAQLADTCRVSLTIVHVVEPGASTIQTRRELDSFMAEADHYDSCRRILVECEDVVKAIVELCEKECFDLIVAPSSDRFGLHSFLTSSRRAKLLKQCCAPLWTAGCCLDRADLKTTIRTIACVIDFEAGNTSYLPMAAALASHIGARLRIVHVVPPVDEGTLTHSIDSDVPLMPEVAVERIHSAFAGQGGCPDVDVVVGDMKKELPRLLSRCEADLAFLGPGHAVNGKWVPRLAPYVDRLPCPAICVDGASASFDRWTFQEIPSETEVRSVVRARNHRMAS